ncbi:efflux RND transporter permease subunit [Sphingomonas abietis]|uniref:Efflux pump membrane transporter n=1 Tax=Sphingomonas abietis TaxID=3012344 RepID=A0ABY7NPM9_9SPHN|nr:multidrug efflux RND transporter permease subunit [Sphingomonas abietis]WBO23162.1 multidrug efflux RND transporter permease subunit [Sphingomonas abietis]
MRFPHFFIERPIFAAVLSILIVIVGIIAYPTLPISQYPQIAPPTVVVSATFPGATAETLADTVAVPIEQQINGVEGMIYMSSSAVGDGTLTITVSFKQGVDADQAQVLVQNRVSEAEPRLPQEVRNIGVTVRKNSPDFLMAIAFYSPDKSLSEQYISNYVTLQIADRIKRVQGVGGSLEIGARDYAMRIWINPDLATARNLTVDEITSAIQAQNAQVAAGSVGAPPFAKGGPAFQLGVQALGRLTTPEQFGDIVVKRGADGSLTRLRDVARVELGAQDYTTNGYFSNQHATMLGIQQLPGSNALATADRIKAVLADAAKSFPPGLAYGIPYHPTDYISASIEEVEHTLYIALILVSIVVLLFLQSWRAAIVPLIAIPISLIGAFGVLAAFGFSLNNLSLFGLVLAIGIVVDDAIVVIENIERLIAEEGLTPREAAHKTMDEVSGALVAIALVLCGVFVPTAFIPGISGQFYQQFALTIVSATAISAFVSLTLSPALAALLLKPHVHGRAVPSGVRGYPTRFANGFNRVFDRLSDRYGRLTGKLVRRLALMGIAYVCLILFAGWRFYSTPTGFIPAQDQGYLIGVIQMPPGTSLERTDEVTRQVQALALKNPALEGTVAFTGFDGATFTTAPNAAVVFTPLKAKGTRDDIDKVTADLRKSLSSITSGNILLIPPPPVSGIGTGGGWKMEIEDRNGAGYEALEKAAFGMMMAANKAPGIAAAFTTFNTKTPRLYADINREKAEQMGVPVANIFSTLGTYLGSTYINDFNYLGRTWRVTAQADASHRQQGSDIEQLQTRSGNGGMVPLAAVLTMKNDAGPWRVVRYNLYPSAELQGDTAHGYSSGQSLKTMAGLAQKVLPKGMSIEWTDLAYQQEQAGNTGIYVFGLAVVFVFLLLAAQYESLILPLAVILIVPMCLLAAILGVGFMGMDNNILTQIGLVVLVGLAAKNAILIVEFARQGEEDGLGHHEAAERAAHQRLRPILMTSIAFILGVLPLVISNGPGSEMRKALGVAVFFGMIGVTFFGLMFTPSFYVITKKFGERISEQTRRWRRRHPSHDVSAEGDLA